MVAEDYGLTGVAIFEVEDFDLFGEKEDVYPMFGGEALQRGDC